MSLKERKSNRWKGFNYASENAYFITICVNDRLCLLGAVSGGEMQLNEYGKIIKQCWNNLPNHYPNCILDEFIIMPNHIHGVIMIDNSVFKPTNITPIGNGLKPYPTRTHGLSEMVRALKTFSSRRVNELSPQRKFHWQKSFHDHVIRDFPSLLKIQQYIIANPLNWEKDTFFNG